LWDTHKLEIEKQTGVKTKEDYKTNSEAQEKYQAHLNKQYIANIPKLKAKYSLAQNIADETLMMLQHYLGYGDASLYLKTLTDTNDYNAAQEAVNKSILTRLQKKNPKAVLPKNKLVVNYLTDFIEKLNNLG
jgi:hypothetical protein